MQLPAIPMQQWAIANQMMLHAGLAALTLIVAAVVVGRYCGGCCGGRCFVMVLLVVVSFVCDYC